MASTTLLTVGQYLATHLSDEYPPEYVHGELVYRSMPKWLHARLESLLSERLNQAGLLCATELHIRVADDVIRIVDVAAYRRAPDEDVPRTPALVLVEIVSPSDPLPEVMRKLDEYAAWGAPQIWLVTPSIGKFHIYRSGGLTEVDRFELPEFNFRISAAELFAAATAR
jgi:Uma2 family endonuclease